MSAPLTDLVQSASLSATVGSTFGSTLGIALATAVFSAGLIASPHCASMCGPLALSVGSNRLRLMSFHAGRGSAYAALGAGAGLLGPRWSAHGAPFWLSALSLGLIALVLLASGARLTLGRPLHLPLPSAVRRLSTKIWHPLLRFSRRYPLGGAAAAGTATIFLPCGHLYAMAAGAMATGTWISGALFMSVFWLSTLPALAFGVAALRRLLLLPGRAAPRAAGALFVLSGFVSLVLFTSRLPMSARTTQDSHSHFGVATSPAKGSLPTTSVTGHAGHGATAETATAAPGAHGCH